MADEISDYNERVAKITGLAQDQDALVNHVSNHVDDLSDSMPNIGQSLSNHIMTGVQYLNSKIPRPKNQLYLDPKWEPSEAEKQKFNEHYDIVNDPVSVLKHIKNGSLTSSAMEALAATHPDLLKDMQSQLKSSASPEIARSLPHHVKRSLSMFMGMPLESSDLQAVKLSNQLVFQGPGQKQQPQMGMNTKPTLGGLKELSVSKRKANPLNESEDEGS